MEQSADAVRVLTAIREVASGLIAEAAERADREREFPAAGLRALREVGAMGLVISLEAGGAGGSLAALAEACEVVGGACASTGMVFLMHSVTAATVGAGGGPRASEVLGSMAQGEHGPAR
jgi:acyl-CoA dehydrogenase